MDYHTQSASCRKDVQEWATKDSASFKHLGLERYQDVSRLHLRSVRAVIAMR